jgi:hypothetical protein
MRSRLVGVDGNGQRITLANDADPKLARPLAWDKVDGFACHPLTRLGNVSGTDKEAQTTRSSDGGPTVTNGRYCILSAHGIACTISINSQGSSSFFRPIGPIRTFCESHGSASLFGNIVRAQQQRSIVADNRALPQHDPRAKV